MPGLLLPTGQPGLYEYTPLQANEIRLIYLECAQRLEDPIICRIMAISVNKDRHTHRYRTLSYAWGPTHPDDSHLTHTVTCDGRLLPVTTNLLQALRRLRESLHAPRPDFENSLVAPYEPALWLWVDAICINQKDMAERAAQVARFSLIYQQAECLHIWLGETSSDAGEGARELQLIRALQHGSSLAQEQRDGLVLSCQRLIERPWFRRRWSLTPVPIDSQVVQEYRISRNRWCVLGDQHFRFESGMRLLRQVAHSPLANRRMASDVPVVKPQPAPLLLELYRNRALHCSLPHDLAYSLFSVSSDADYTTIDYTRPFKDLFHTIAARSATRSAPELQTLLALASRYNSNMLPSWVPDWRVTLYTCGAGMESQDRAVVVACMRFFQHHRKLNEYHERAPAIETSVDGGSLTLLAYIIKPCFPPRHPSDGSCLSCAMCATAWTSFWHGELKLGLCSLAADGCVLMVLRDQKGGHLAFALKARAGDRGLEVDPAYRIRSCFSIPFTKGFRKRLLYHPITRIRIV